MLCTFFRSSNNFTKDAKPPQNKTIENHIPGVPKLFFSTTPFKTFNYSVRPYVNVYVHARTHVYMYMRERTCVYYYIISSSWIQFFLSARSIKKTQNLPADKLINLNYFPTNHSKSSLTKHHCDDMRCAYT